MPNSKALQRQEYIRRSLEIYGKVSTKDMAEKLKVSIWTIRRDLSSLEHHGILSRYYGGADPNQSYEESRTGNECDSYRTVSTYNQEAKRCIGLTAARFLQSGDRVAIAGGTTTLEVAKALKTNHFKGEIVTNALDIALELSEEPDIRLACTGGDLQPRYRTLVGKTAEHMLKQQYFDVAVIGVTGISTRQGITVNSQIDARGLELMMDHSIRTIMVVDHSKFGRVCYAPLSLTGSITCLVTDKLPASEYSELMQKMNVQVIIADRLLNGAWINGKNEQI